MNKVVLFFLCLTSTAVFAQDSGNAAPGADDPVDLRVDVFEVINVTAEKTPALPADGADPDIDAILEEAEAIESE